MPDVLHCDVRDITDTNAHTNVMKPRDHGSNTSEHRTHQSQQRRESSQARANFSEWNRLRVPNIIDLLGAWWCSQIRPKRCFTCIFWRLQTVLDNLSSCENVELKPCTIGQVAWQLRAVGAVAEEVDETRQVLKQEVTRSGRGASRDRASCPCHVGKLITLRTVCFLH